MYGLHRAEIAGVAAVAAFAAPAGVASADHDMAMMSSDHRDGSELSVGISVVAAEFSTMSYIGSYQGVTPSATWMRGPLGASATLGLYHLDENGLSTYGVGDVMLTGHAAVIETDALGAGVAMHVMLPTGSEPANLGMGHVMLMPSAWTTWRARPVTLTASAGYARAWTDLGGGHHDHGPAPLVDPMNLQELTWSAGGDLAVGHSIALGGRAHGGIPIGAGRNRVIGGGRVGWGTPHVSTAFELQVGIAGDPFTIRGVIETALRF